MNGMERVYTEKVVKKERKRESFSFWSEIEKETKSNERKIVK